MRIDDAVHHIVEEAGKAFDPDVVSLIAKNYKQWETLFAAHPTGDFVDSIFAAQREAQTLLELTNTLNGSIDLDGTFVALRKALRQLAAFQTMVGVDRAPPSELPSQAAVLEPTFW